MSLLRTKVVLTKVSKLVDREELEFYILDQNEGTIVASVDCCDSRFLNVSTTQRRLPVYLPETALGLTIRNPALLGTFKPGRQFFIDLTEVPPAP